MPTQWIVVSDAAEARIFSRTAKYGDLTRVDTLTHAESRAHEGDLRTGGKGAVQESSGAGQHQPDPHTTTGEKHADIFARQVAARLKSAFNEQAFEELVIAAGPSFLGDLREQLDAPLQKILIRTIDKNWAQHSDGQIQKLLNDK